jgi:spore germination protein YaaH
MKGMVINMERKTKLAVIGSAIAVIIIAIALIAMVVEKLTPSKEVMKLTDYYKLKDSEVLVVLQNEVYEKKGMLLDGIVYIDYETVAEKFNKRFYWDYNENILTYTTPDEIIRAEAGSREYTVTKSTIETKVDSNYPIVKVFADKVYLALDFVKEYSDLTFELYKDPNRVVINYKWGDFLFTEVKKPTQLRYEASIKSPILLQLTAGTSLMYVDTEEAPKNGFVKVMTTDGVKGYVKTKQVKKASYQKLESSFQKPEYTSQTRPGKINMAFHQVLNSDANQYLADTVDSVKGVNVIAPTWFSISDESASLVSRADTAYVEKAKELGLEVWAVVDDFNENPDLDMLKLLSHTSSRDNLTNQLIEAALEYKLNGINIDIETISQEAGIHYIQFLRELSVKCRNNGIVLSVDSYPPSEYSKYYDREEQGTIADYVVVMAYNEFHGNSEVAGPVSSIGFLQDSVNNILEMVPKEKTIIAIPFYTRLWKETSEGELTSEILTMSESAELVENNNLEAAWDDTNGCNYYEFKKDGATYYLWQEDDKSIEQKMKAIYNADIAGVAEWKLGLENDSVWDVITRYINK